MLKEELEKINFKIVESESRYVFDGHAVPRVTEILSAMLHEEYIVKWANSLGFKHKGYMATLNEASTKGTYSHNAIEKFLIHNELPEYDSLPYICANVVKNTFGSFLSWWDAISSVNDVEVVFVEKKLSCKWFGGTLDALFKINGKYWLIDFKTSNHLSYRYSLQLAAYRYMLRECEGIEVDGCLVLQLDKTSIHFTEQVIDLSLDDHLKYINKCEDGFMALLYAYYMRVEIENSYNTLFKNKRRSNND